jgi:hypothetical protein
LPSSFILPQNQHQTAALTNINTRGPSNSNHKSTLQIQKGNQVNLKYRNTKISHHNTSGMPPPLPSRDNIPPIALPPGSVPYTYQSDGNILYLDEPDYSMPYQTQSERSIPQQARPLAGMLQRSILVDHLFMFEPHEVQDFVKPLQFSRAAEEAAILYLSGASVKQQLHKGLIIAYKRMKMSRGFYPSPYAHIANEQFPYFQDFPVSEESRRALAVDLCKAVMWLSKNDRMVLLQEAGIPQLTNSDYDDWYYLEKNLERLDLAAYWIRMGAHEAWEAVETSCYQYCLDNWRMILQQNTHMLNGWMEIFNHYPLETKKQAMVDLVDLGLIKSCPNIEVIQEYWRPGPLLQVLFQKKLTDKIHTMKIEGALFGHYPHTAQVSTDSGLQIAPESQESQQSHNDFRF